MAHQAARSDDRRNAALGGDQAFTFIADPTAPRTDWTGRSGATTDARGITTIYASNDAEMSIYMSQG